MNNMILKRWNVFIIPNNQPTIEIGEYYATSADAAIELAAVDMMTKSDDNWQAEEIL